MLQKWSVPRSSIKNSFVFAVPGLRAPFLWDKFIFWGSKLSTKPVGPCKRAFIGIGLRPPWQHMKFRCSIIMGLRSRRHRIRSMTIEIG